MKGYETLHYPFIYYHLPLKNHESEVPFYKNIYPFFNMKNEISIAKTFKAWLWKYNLLLACMKNDISVLSMITSGGNFDVDSICENENWPMKEAPICKICMDNEVDLVLLPCGHLISCVNCAHKLKDCPVCRQFIKRIVRTFMPWNFLSQVFLT